MRNPCQLFELTGRVAVVTGSTRGLGRTIVEAFARAGASVVVSGRKQDACDSVAAYGAAKAALRHLTVLMSKEWAPWNVRVNILSPGSFATEMLSTAEKFQPGSRAMLASMNSQNRVADVSEIIGPALYLASQASSFCHR